MPLKNSKNTISISLEELGKLAWLNKSHLVHIARHRFSHYFFQSHNYKKHLARHTNIWTDLICIINETEFYISQVIPYMANLFLVISCNQIKHSAYGFYGEMLRSAICKTSLKASILSPAVILGAPVCTYRSD